MVESADKNDKLLIASVAIDGARIRSIRENKKLTQLYVASVVGVTTDTISRWENNRYPSIKRDNAQKLADALEVPLEEIIRPDAPEAVEVPAPPLPAGNSRRWGLILAGILLVILLVVLVLFLLRKPEPPPSALRWAPRFAAPGEIIPVQVKVARQPGSPFGFILRERLPAGLRLVSALPPASATETEAKWLVPRDGTSATVSYSLQVPPGFSAGKDAALKGEIVIHATPSNRTEAVGGSTSIHIGAYHWADSNGDGRIDDDEIMPAYYICEEMKGLGLDWKTIEAIWSGKGYRWAPTTGYTVLK